MTKKLNFETNCLHAGYSPKEGSLSIDVPISLSTAFDFLSFQRGADLFNLEVSGDIYSRISNPTNRILEERLTELEGGVGCVCFSSGMAAITSCVLNITKTGENIVASPNLYGGTVNLFSHTFKGLGIDVRFAKNEDDIEEFEKLIDDKTKCIFIEILCNPSLSIADIEGLAKLAHKHKIPLIIDNTIPTPYLCRPFEWGADIVVHSTTKYISGHGNAMGGAVIDSGKFDWEGSGKFTGLTEPDPSYHGTIYTKSFKNQAYIVKLRTQFLRDIGACPSPFNSYFTIVGLETLALRMDRHCSNALKLAQFLEKHPCISWVNYPGLKGNKFYEKAQKYTPKGCSSIVCFGVKGGIPECAKFIENLKIPFYTTNLGDSRSICTHPCSTTHRQLTDDARKACGITDDLIRFSVGLENIDDIIADIDNALKASQR